MLGLLFCSQARIEANSDEVAREADGCVVVVTGRKYRLVVVEGSTVVVVVGSGSVVVVGSGAVAAEVNSAAVEGTSGAGDGLGIISPLPEQPTSATRANPAARLPTREGRVRGRDLDFG
jgi:hypothetical protein